MLFFQLYVDIEEISDRISNYYSRYGALPVLKSIDLSSDATISSWKNNTNNDSPLGANDTGNFYVIDLKELENLTLNYGTDYEKINGEHGNDLYVINENSHNVFYLKGIKVSNNNASKMYYTNQEKDTEKVDIRFIDGIKIPSGYKYESGKTKNDLKIKNTELNAVFSWANTQDEVYTITKSGNDYYLNNSTGLNAKIELVEEQDMDDLILSAKENAGFFYKNGTTSGTVNVLYASVAEEDNWGIVYADEGIYTDRNGDKAYIPKGFKTSRLSILNTIKDGLVIKNATTGDEYVWIEVPKKVLSDANTLEEIENALKDYTQGYRQEGYEDTWYEECGISQIRYNELKNKMLQSIKLNGGFYIGRYEAGTDKARTAGDSNELAETIIENGYGKPLSQKDKYPYNWITAVQAQGLAQSVKPENADYETSLMFGLQWDLVCKFIEETGAKSYEEIAIDSTEWGNFRNSSFEITSDNAVHAVHSTLRSWDNATKGTIKSSDSIELFSTASSKKNKTLNIYDFAGNDLEWILERKINENSKKSIARGGNGYRNSGASWVGDQFYGTASFAYNNIQSHIDWMIGFRVTIF